MTSQTKMGAVVELNVGGVNYATTLATLSRDRSSLLAEWFNPEKLQNVDEAAVLRDSAGRYFIDRDGVLFRFVVDFLRSGRLVLPENFQELERLEDEAQFYRLSGLVQCIAQQRRQRSRNGSETSTTTTTTVLSGAASELCVGPTSGRCAGFIVVGYRGTFAFGGGRDGNIADIKFRKLWRILICGRVSLCREVFGDSLNESRDADRGDGLRYSARFFLKHAFLEQAFDALLESGFLLVGSCGSGTNGATSGDVKQPGVDGEEARWNHYNEFVFCRR